MKKIIAISGGGTGGHLAIAKALMQECNKAQIPCIYIGSTAGQDKAWFESEKGFSHRYFLPTQGVVNKRGIGMIKSLFLQLKSTFLDREFSSAPASFASILARIPLFIHEQNAIKGTLNRFLSPFAKKIFGSFEDSSKNFYPTSYPVREEFFALARERKELKCILFLGGSQGAVAINDFALSIAPLLHQKGIKIIHQSGERDYERLKEQYAKLNIPVELFAFSSKLVEKMKEADFCISRAGASSVWEMCATALPALYIPYPYAAGNHQYCNALFFSSKNLGILCEQKDLNSQILEQILAFPIAKVSNSLPTHISPNGAKEILESILKNSL